MTETIQAGTRVDGLILPAGSFDAYLFDLDGTIADSMPLHYITWKRAVEEYGGTFPEELFYSLGGVTLPRTVEILNERLGYNMPPNEVAARKEDLYIEMLPELKPIVAVVAVIEQWRGRVKFAVVSGSPRKSIVKTLSVLGLLADFPVIVGAEDYAHGKPDPEPFLTAATRLGVTPGSCLVFEDADAGIASAEAAGMQWVRIPHAHERVAEIRAMAESAAAQPDAAQPAGAGAESSSR